MRGCRCCTLQLMKTFLNAGAHLLANDSSYLIYFAVLVGGAGLLAVLRHFGVVSDQINLGPGLTAEVKRGPESIAKLSTIFATIFVVLNLGVAQLVFPLLSPQVGRFAFVMVVLESLAWAYLLFRWPLLTNWLIGLRLT
jgi:hypothetical protein